MVPKKEVCVSERVKENASNMTIKTYLIPEFRSSEWFLKKEKYILKERRGIEPKSWCPATRPQKLT
jgi:hypothetical protein